jgi:preprotein translocase subunit SecA
VLLDGMVAEMETGEGKTLTATLPACTVALSGIPVHIITVNDYLAKRDAEWMGPVFSALGLTVGVIQGGMDPMTRRAIYASDISYCTNKEVAFDYLKDRIVLGQQPRHMQLQLERLGGDGSRLDRLILRGLHYGIVDEADSVLIDEARTPLIISGPGKDKTERKVYEEAFSLAGQLNPETDFTIDVKARTVKLTPSGSHWLQQCAGSYGKIWNSRLRREELVKQALTAYHLFHRDKQYLIHEGKIKIVDEYTGRVMGDRSWERGLHQMIEVKEGCELGQRQDPLARMTYQRFFRRYLRLAGMTGTAKEVVKEFWDVYRLPVVKIPTNMPVQRQAAAPLIYPTETEKWNGIVQEIKQKYTEGRPILVGTRSVASSEHLGKLLSETHIPYQLLNARQDAQEAEIVAKAGEAAQVTVATNMAGRGTDIRLGQEVAKRGGLHVIATECHESPRIDRQLFGRCGRQGDPGSYHLIASLEDELMMRYGKGVWRWVLSHVVPESGNLRTVVVRWFIAHTQRAAQRHHRVIRRDLQKSDEQLESTLAFSGHLE